jgi:hypothetical protein
MPTVSWKNRRICSKKSISGWKTLAKTTTDQESGGPGVRESDESEVRGDGRRLKTL